jgi:hypothetical protein
LGCACRDALSYLCILAVDLDERLVARQKGNYMEFSLRSIRRSSGATCALLVSCSCVHGLIGQLSVKISQRYLAAMSCWRCSWKGQGIVKNTCRLLDHTSANCNAFEYDKSIAKDVCTQTNNVCSSWKREANVCQSVIQLPAAHRMMFILQQTVINR